jgi:predicted Kef-type K+ transport protein
MSSLYWLIVGGLAVVVLLVLAVAIADVLHTAGRGPFQGTPRRTRPR